MASRLSVYKADGGDGYGIRTGIEMLEIPGGGEGLSAGGSAARKKERTQGRLKGE
jgi:hypothetical protein